MPDPLTDQQKQAIADELLGSANIGTVFRLAEECGVEDIDIMVAAEDFDVIECEGCNWFCESGEMDDDRLCMDCQDAANE